MDLIQLIVEIINNVGFPIACVCVMFYQMEQERNAHKSESEAWVEALNRNTNVMEKVLDHLEVNK